MLVLYIYKKKNLKLKDKIKKKTLIEKKTQKKKRKKKQIISPMNSAL
jgi:hypothetical protein